MSCTGVIVSAKLILILSCLITVAAVGAAPGPVGPATVCVARNETILVPQGIFAPKLLLPERSRIHSHE